MRGLPEPVEKQWPLGEPVRPEKPTQPDWYVHPENKEIEVNRYTGRIRTRVPNPSVWYPQC